MRLTLDEYSKHFKMSKEMIYSKIKAKKLDSIVENDITYIVSIIEERIAPKKIISPPAKQKTTVAMVIALYQRENQQLKDKIMQLENKVDKLIDDKEQMLRDEMSKIEQVYSNKDEQLKNILELINTKLISENSNTIHEVETVEGDKEEKEIVELKSYLKNLDLTNHQKKFIKKKFLSAYGSDIRVIKQNGKLYLDFSKYDYSDLLE